jgi:hypothetical protein
MEKRSRSTDKVEVSGEKKEAVNERTVEKKELSAENIKKMFELINYKASER